MLWPLAMRSTLVVVLVRCKVHYAATSEGLGVLQTCHCGVYAAIPYYVRQNGSTRSTHRTDPT